MIGLEILLISDDCETARIWCYALACRGAQVIAEQAHPFVTRRHGSKPPGDLIVVDLSQTSIAATLHLCTLARAGADCPLILFTDHADEALYVELYDAGVDDCVPKPISPALFLAKVKAWARHTGRSARHTPNAQDVGGIRLDPLKHQVSVMVHPSVHLTNLEFRVLQLLMDNCGRTLAAQEIIRRVWGYDSEDGNEVLKNVVYRLRSKLEDDPHVPRFIQTVPGQGYMFMPADGARAERPEAIPS